MDVMMICKNSIEAWAQNSQLSADKNTRFEAGQKSLDDYKSTASRLIMTHELSHSREVMGHNRAGTFFPFISALRVCTNTGAQPAIRQFSRVSWS